MSGGVLAIRLRALGDVVLTTPALRALKRGHPQHRLEVLTDVRYVDLVAGVSEVDRVWGLGRSHGETLAIIARLRRQRYVLAVDFFGNPRSALVTRWCGARRRAGYDLRGRRHAYHLRVPRDAPGPQGRREHASAAHLRLAAAAGGIPDGEPPRLSVGEPAHREADAVLRMIGLEEAGDVIGLVAAGTWPTKTWPAAHAGALARHLQARGYRMLLIGGPGEEAVTEVVTRLAPGVAVLPRCGVAALAAVIARLRAVVGTDSGPRHLAAALGVPTFAWFGPTHPDTWQPPGAQHGFWQTPLPCRGCDRTTCPHWNCLPGLDPAEAALRVIDHVEGLVGRPAALGSAAGA